MWTLVRKNSKHFVLYTIPMSLILFYFWLGIEPKEDDYYVFMQLLWMLVITSGAISVNEINEDKNNGYLILKSLPITDKEIVYSKFFISAMSIIYLTIFNIIMAYFIIKTPEISKIIYQLLVLWGIVSLLLSASTYISIFKIGVLKSEKYMILVIPLVVLFIIFNDFISDLLSKIFDIIIVFINTGFWIILIPIGLIAYIKLLQKAVAVKENTEVT